MAPRRTHSHEPKKLLSSYGLMWRRDWVDWDLTGDGFLPGRDNTAKVDFGNQCGVYILYDANKRAIYAGQAGTGKSGLFRRLARHTDRLNSRLADRWVYFSWFGLLKISPAIDDKGFQSLRNKASRPKGYYSNLKSVVDVLEGILIEAMEPFLNKKGPNFRGVRRFTQRRTSDSEASKALKVQTDVLLALDQIKAKLSIRSGKTKKIK